MSMSEQPRTPMVLAIATVGTACSAETGVVDDVQAESVAEPWLEASCRTNPCTAANSCAVAPGNGLCARQEAGSFATSPNDTYGVKNCVGTYSVEIRANTYEGYVINVRPAKAVSKADCPKLRVYGRAYTKDSDGTWTRIEGYYKTQGTWDSFYGCTLVPGTNDDPAGVPWVRDGASRSKGRNRQYQ